MEVLGHEALAVDLDAIRSWVGLGAELVHHPPVHPDPSGDDDFFGGAPRSHACLRDNLLKPLLHRHVLSTRDAPRRQTMGT